jgi:HK97 family phage portal protein
MATFWQRLTNKAPETRAVQPTIPSRSATVVTPDSALSLTAVYRAVQILATPISKMGINTYRFATGIELKIENPIIINKPSLTDTRRDFIFQTVTSLALEGNAFWFKNRSRDGSVNNLTIVPASAVSIQYVDSNDISRGVDYYYSGKKYTADQVEHLKLFTKPGELRGIAPIQAAYKDIAAALDLRDYAGNWFNAAGVPTGILTTNALLSKDEADDITANWHNKQQNRQVAVLGQGMNYESVALSPREALFTEIQNQAVQTIARLMGIPARLLITSIPGSSDTYTNLSDENQVFYRHTLMAYTDTITDGFSNCLPRGTRVEFDFESLFKADIAERYGYYKVGVDGGWLSTEEVRTKEGLDV